MRSPFTSPLAGEVDRRREATAGGRGVIELAKSDGIHPPP